MSLSDESPDELRMRAEHYYEEGWIGSGKRRHMLRIADVREEILHSLDQALSRDTERDAIPAGHEMAGPPRWRGLK